MALFSKKQKAEIPRRRQAAAREERQAQLDDQTSQLFRRNQTLTGSASSRISSPGESNAQMKSPRVQTHELTQKRRHVGGILGLVLMICGVLYLLLTQLSATVITRASVASIKLDASYAVAINDYFATQPLERLRFVTNMNHLNEYVQAKVPEVASITMNGSDGFGKTVFSLTMRRPIVSWNINGRIEYVDDTGTSFGRNYFATPAVQVIDKSGVQVQAGQTVASNRFLAFVGRAVGLSKQQNFTVTQVIIPEGTTRQIELQLQGIAYPIKLSIDRGVGEQIEDMARAIHWLQAHGQTPQYLDVRVAGEAFYR